MDEKLLRHIEENDDLHELELEFVRSFLIAMGVLPAT